MPRFDLDLFADYFQFYLQDDDTRFGDLSEAWTPEAVENLLALGDHAIGIGTSRNTDVPVFIHVCETLPILNPSEWDRLNAATITCDTGRLVVAGCTEYFPDAFRLEVPPGAYDVAIGYRELDKISADRLDGDDSYHLYIAPKP